MNTNCEQCSHCVKVELMDLPDAGVIFHFCDQAEVGRNPEGLKDDSSLDDSWGECLGTYRKIPEEINQTIDKQ